MHPQRIAVVPLEQGRESWSRSRSLPMEDPMETAHVTRPPDLTRISPELALVDPELARRLRHRIPRKRLGHRPPLPVLRLPAGVGAVPEARLESSAL